MTRMGFDPKLGPTRWCPRCEEAWPYTEAFWTFRVIEPGTPQRHSHGRPYRYVTGTTAVQCRACGWRIATYRKRKAELGGGALVVIIGPAPCHDCGRPLQWVRRDGLLRWENVDGETHRCTARAAA